MFAKGINFNFVKKNIVKSRKFAYSWNKIKNILIGSNVKRGLIIQLIIYTILISVGFVYLYPLLYMIVTSMKSLSDLLDSSINWIPSGFYIKNYIQAMNVMNFKSAIIGSFYIALVPTLFQVFVCSLVGYGFARYDFFGKRILFALVIFTFVIPPQITMMPTYVLYSRLGLIGTMKAFIFPALLGQGFKSAIFIFIFYQFYRQTPKVLYEAAEIDGAGHLTCYFKIAIPTSIPAFIVSFLFSFVWYWNETYLTQLYLGNSGMGTNSSITTILLQLQQFEANYNALYPANVYTTMRINEAIEMAGTVISILPLLIIYFILQKYFVESVDRIGITGE